MPHSLWRHVMRVGVVVGVDDTTTQAVRAARVATLEIRWQTNGSDTMVHAR